MYCTQGRRITRRSQTNNALNRTRTQFTNTSEVDGETRFSH